MQINIFNPETLTQICTGSDDKSITKIDINELSISIWSGSKLLDLHRLGTCFEVTVSSDSNAIEFESVTVKSQNNS
jgi:hypothetical protein